MPEGHVTHRLAHELTAAFGGRPVRVASPQGRFAEASAVDGAVLDHAEAYGKHLFIEFDPSRIVTIHLGLIGKLRLLEAGEKEPVAPARLRISAGGVVAELRAPQTCQLIADVDRQAVMARLGADPLRTDARPELAWRKIHASPRSIASLLMDQGVTAGVGNIYRAEVLFRNRVPPLLPGRELSRLKWNRIWADLVQLMALGVRDARVDTVREQHTPEAMGREPRVDRHGGEVYVYRRHGQACLVCGRPVRTDLVEGRNLYWCSRCQRGS
ncbi:MAG: DNA-formamidopyrimidine glycosylase family protein [Micropruina sp.]